MPRGQYPLVDSRTAHFFERSSWWEHDIAHLEDELLCGGPNRGIILGEIFCNDNDVEDEGSFVGDTILNTYSVDSLRMEDFGGGL